MAYRFEIAARARRDLHDIWNYIAQDNPGAASDFCAKLVDEAESLCVFPLRGRLISGQVPARKIVHGSYVIFYDVNEAEHRVEILRFWHGAQHPRGLRLKEEAAGYGQVTLAPFAAATT